MDTAGGSVHAEVATRAGTAALADAVPSDIEAIFHYWHDSSDAHLAHLGIDRGLFHDRGAFHDRLGAMIRTGDLAQRRTVFVIRLNDAFAGFTMLYRYMPETNYSHWHIATSELRGAGISTALYPHRIKMYFDLFPLTRLIHQTRTRNIGVNRMLDKFVPVAETGFVAQPDGNAAPGEFHTRYVHRADIPALFRRAAELDLGDAPP